MQNESSPFYLQNGNRQSKQNPDRIDREDGDNRIKASGKHGCRFYVQCPSADKRESSDDVLNHKQGSNEKHARAIKRLAVT